MADMRELWWAAGRLAFPVSTTEWMNHRWQQALRRSAALLEPVWQKNDSDVSLYDALPTTALVLYAGPDDNEPDDIPVEQLVAALRPRPPGASEPAIEDLIREGLAKRGHDLDDDSPLSALFRRLTEYHPPIAYTAGGIELSAADHWPGGTMMGDTARGLTHWFTYHHLNTSST